MSVGSFLKAQRRKRNLDIGAMAMAIGITKGHLSEFENDKAVPKAKSLERVLNFFQMSELQFRAQCNEHKTELPA